ncbi:hypothetical protein FEM48_Zijuj01G0164100 [Ziziphus jujuba var. spinosa]|uniref:Gamma-glutamyl peptidase 5-like n=1 Tax=Ziziphus jujuba var. spinosa TaxID=714518 RepID=A0A978W2A9_ZIZJJ|nr:hypothetical protein FEM48_Zijuj01G0164100 [Ziziphus jujuba var. spinosa]
MKVKGEQQRRYAVLLTRRDSDSEYVKKVYGGWFNLYVATYGEEGDRWDLFRVVDGEFPDMNDLINYDGFVIGGSPYDAYGNDAWIVKLCFLLHTLDAMSKKLLVICFGSVQGIGRKDWEGIHSGWDVTIRKTKRGWVEIFTIGNHILGIQGHPEYSNGMLNILIDLLNNGSMERGFAENAKLRLQKAEPADRKCWEKICRNFLKGN